MQYIYRYPRNIRRINRRRQGLIAISIPHLAQTHEELLLRLDIPGRTFNLRFDVPASRASVWEIAAGSVSRFFSHHRAFAGATSLNGLGPGEGERYIIHRDFNGKVVDRLGEVLICLPMAHLTVSDLEIADPGVSGLLPLLHTIRLEDAPGWRTRVKLSYTVLSVGYPGGAEMLLHQAASIGNAVEGRFTLR